MNRDEILNLAKNDSERGKEFEKESLIKSDAIVGYIGILLCIALILINYFAKHDISYDLLTVVFSISAISQIKEGKINERRISMCGGIICAIVAVLFLIVYILELTI